MLSRRVVAKLPSVARAVTAAAKRPLVTTSLLNDAEIIAHNEIPVKTYATEATAPEVEILQVDQSAAPTATPATPVLDAVKHAVALDKEAAAKLTPTMKKFLVQDKVAIITGGARGLGWNMAQALAEAGAKAVAILDVNQENGDAAAADLHSTTGIAAQFYKVDVRDGNSIAECVAAVTEKFGSVDILINSAGIADSNIKAEEYDHDMYRRLIDINVTGAFLVAQACGRQMIKQGTGGSIIMIASMSGLIVNYPQEQSCYNASKAAVIQMTRSLGAEWAQHNIRVNAISPGYMDTALNRVPTLEGQKKIWTSLTPQARLGNVDDLNNTAVFLASDASTFMTGANCVVDGGYSLW